MKIRLPKRPQHYAPHSLAVLAQCCLKLDAAIPALRTALLVIGVVGAALRVGLVADCLFVAGLLFHLAIWFQDWWSASPPKP